MKEPHPLLPLAVVAGAFTLLMGGLAVFSTWSLPKGERPRPAAIDTTPKVPIEGLRNVVVVVVDTLRADALGVYGNERETSPKIDKWAKRAVVFEAAQAHGTYTPASYVSYMSSVPVREHGWDFAINVEEPDRAPRELCSRDDLEMLPEVLAEAGIKTTAWVGNRLLHVKRGYPRGFETWNQFVVPMLATKKIKRKDVKKTTDAAIVTAVEKEVAGWTPYERNFLYVHLMKPHLPHKPDKAARKKFGLPDKGNVTPNEINTLREASTPAQRAQTVDYYHAGVWEADRLMQRIFKATNRKDTAVVFFSDHGEELWEHDDYGHVDGVWEPLAHVPLMIRAPGEKGRRVSHPVGLVDVAPTVAALFGVDAPDGWRGADLLADPEPRPVVTQRLTEVAVSDGSGKKAIRTKDGTWSLYDPKADVAEANALKDKATLKRLTDAYAAFEAEVPVGSVEREDGKPEGICGVLKGKEKKEHVEALRALGYVE